MHAGTCRAEQDCSRPLNFSSCWDTRKILDRTIAKVHSIAGDELIRERTEIGDIPSPRMEQDQENLEDFRGLPILNPTSAPVLYGTRNANVVRAPLNPWRCRMCQSCRSIHQAARHLLH